MSQTVLLEEHVGKEAEFQLTAPYLDTCRTKRAASLKSGSGTMVGCFCEVDRAREV